MYLSAKRIKALNIALEALEFGTQNNVQPDDSAFAFDVITEMVRGSKVKRLYRLAEGVKNDFKTTN